MALPGAHSSKRLKVLIFTSLFPNSVRPILGNFVMERMRHVRPYADLSVIAPVPYFPRWNVNKRWYEFSRIPTSENFGEFELDHPRFLVVPKVGMSTHGLAMFLGSARRVFARIREKQYDVIDAHYVYPDGFAAVLLGSWLNIPVVVSARGSDINLFPKFPTIRPLIRHVLNRADALIAVSQGLKDAMVEIGCPPHKVTVIGNGVDSVKFRPRHQAEMRRLLGLPAKRPILLSIGNLSENKGFHILIDALSSLRLHRADVLLVIIGEGVYKSYLERKIRNLGLEDNVKLIGSQPHDQLSAWYSAADVFCLASATEGWPNVIMEAMACGRPVIATRSAAPMLNAPQLGILVERTPQEFQHAMEQALDRKWDHELIVEHARSNGWDKVAQRVLSVFSDVVAQSR
jgi:teichuronic acid biosynthesis glycosyltransferase TuaC